MHQIASRLLWCLGLLLLLGITLTQAAQLAPAASLGQSCTPRPPVGVTVTPTGSQHGDVAVTLTAASAAGGPQNTLESVRFNDIQDARIDAGSLTDQTHNLALSLPAGTEQFSFLVHPTQAGVTPTVHLVVNDACGAW